MIRKLITYILLIAPVILQAQIAEKVYVQTDKPAYHAGEIIWFRADVTDAGTNKPLTASKVVYAELLDENNKAVVHGKIELRDAKGEGSFHVPLNIMPGVYTFRAYTNWMKNFSQENYFTKQIQLFNVRFAGSQTMVYKFANKVQANGLNIKAETDKAVYRTREKISLNVSSSMLADVSVSVYKIDSLLMVGSDTYQRSEGKALPVDHSFSYIPGYNRQIITGRIIDIRTGQPAPGVKGYLSVQGVKNIFRTGSSDASGIIRFDMKGISGRNRIILQTNSRTDSNYRIQLVEPFINTFHTNTNVPDSVAVSNALLLESSLSAQVQSAYTPAVVNLFADPAYDSIPFYGKAEVGYDIEDYVKFPTMEEVIREYVTPVGMQRRNGKLHPFVYDALTRKIFNDYPLVLINGVPVFDMDKVMAFNPAMIKRIEVVDHRYFLGRDNFGGIVNIITTDSILNDGEFDKNVQIADYEGLQLQRKFYSPVYETEEQRSSRMPDFRNVLYWNPDIRLDMGREQNIQLYSSDLKGRYAVVVKGITDNGDTGTATTYIEIQ